MDNAGLKAEQLDAIRIVAQKRKELRQLNTAKSRIGLAAKKLKKEIAESEKAIYTPYEPETEATTEQTFRQLELFT